MMAETQSILPQQPQPPQQEGPQVQITPLVAEAVILGLVTPRNWAQRALRALVVVTTVYSNLHRSNLAKEYQFNNGQTDLPRPASVGQ